MGKPPVPKLDLVALGLANNVSSQVADGPNKLYCAGLPHSLQEPQVKMLFESYGPLKALYLPKDPQTTLCKGWAFFEYRDAKVSDAAIQGLDKLQVGEQILQVRRAENKSQDPMDTLALMGGMGAANPLMAGLNPLAGAGVAGMMGMDPARAMLMGVGAAAAPAQAPTHVVCLLQMVTAEELKVPEEYAEILEDIEQECKNYGTVSSVRIPKPGEPGCGKVFVEYGSVESATKAIGALQGRKFAQRTILASYFDEENFKAGKYDA
jgi:splicing factor U2AF 65 kDa subunit